MKSSWKSKKCHEQTATPGLGANKLLSNQCHLVGYRKIIIYEAQEMANIHCQSVILLNYNVSDFFFYMTDTVIFLNTFLLTWF